MQGHEKFGVTRKFLLPSSHAHLCKKDFFPQQLEDSSTDEEEAFADSESNASLSDGDASLAPQTNKLVIFKCGDFVIANVHTVAGSKNFY